MQRGFSSVLLLFVIGSVLTQSFLFPLYVNPSQQFAEANNTKRSSDISQILNAIDQYMADHQGNLPPGIDSSAYNDQKIDIKSSMKDSDGTGVDFCNALIPTYFAALPSDPLSTTNGGYVTNCGSYDTGYTISIDSSDTTRVTISAPKAEKVNGVAPHISITR